MNPHPGRSAIQACPQGEQFVDCGLTCKYNVFESPDGDLRIDSWELKCLDCGLRQTVAVRSDDSQADASVDPSQCPFCQFAACQPGRNLCSE